MLAAVLVYAAFLAPSLGLDRVRGDVLGSLFYVANWHFIASGQSYFSSFTSPSPVLHLWSLAVEEQFYLFWPPIVLGVLWLARRRFRANGAVIAVGIVAVLGAVASAVLMASLYVQGGDPSRVYYGTDTRAQAMLIGAALAVVVTLHGPLRSRAARSVLSVAAALGFFVVVLPWFASNATRVHDVFYGHFGLLAYSCATAIVIWRLAQPSSGRARARARAEPGHLGRRDLVRDVPLALAPLPRDHPRANRGDRRCRCCSCGWRRWSRSRPSRTSTSGSPSAGACGSARRSSRGSRPWPSSSRSASASSPRPSARVRCSAATSGRWPTDGGPPPDTTPSASAAPLKVLVVGDSQAATLAQGLDADPGQTGLSAQPGLAVWNRAILGCSIITVDTFVIDGNREQNKCGGAGAWQAQWSSDVAAFTPDVVVVQAGAWDLFDVAGPDGTVIRPGDPNWTTGYTRDVQLLFDTVAAKGAAIVAVRPPCYGTNEVVGGGTTPAIRLDAARINAVAAVWQRVARARGIRLLNLDPTLCPGGVSDGSIRPDGAHYSNDGANRVAPIVAKAARAAAATQTLAGK